MRTEKSPQKEIPVGIATTYRFTVGQLKRAVEELSGYDAKLLSTSPGIEKAYRELTHAYNASDTGLFEIAKQKLSMLTQLRLAFSIDQLNETLKRQRRPANTISSPTGRPQIFLTPEGHSYRQSSACFH